MLASLGPQVGLQSIKEQNVKNYLQGGFCQTISRGFVKMCWLLKL